MSINGYVNFKKIRFIIESDALMRIAVLIKKIKGLALFGSHASAFLQSIERDNFKSIQVSDLNKLSTEKVFERLSKKLQDQA